MAYDKSLQVPESKEMAFGLLRDFLESKPGFETGNYSTMSAYRADQRQATRALHKGRKLLLDAQVYPYFPEAMSRAMKAFSGRLEFYQPSIAKHPEMWDTTYCTGQYYPTEYRWAVVAVLESYLRQV